MFSIVATKAKLGGKMRKKSLKKINILSLIVLLAVCTLFGCKKEVQLNDYKLEDVAENQAVFVYEHLNAYPTSFVWIFNKQGKCKRVDFKYFSKVKMMGEGSEEALLKAADGCMQDENIPFRERAFNVSEEMVSYCVRYPGLHLEASNDVPVMDASEEYYYMICGTKEDRHLVKVKQWGTWEAEPEDEKLQEICNQIKTYVNDNW